MTKNTDTAARTPLEHLFERLDAAGLPIDYVRKTAFPSWWHDEIATERSGYERALGFIHRTIGVSIDQLWDDDAVISCPAMGKVHFKKAKGFTEKDFEWARCIGVSAARLALTAIQKPYVALPHDPCEVRDQILARGNAHVDLDNLLDLLWEHGIPVLHIADFPGKKMVGLAASVHDRPAIVLSKCHKYPSLVVFDLAHELGHVLNGDLKSDDVILDESIDSKGETDPREVEATRSGIAVLTGNKDTQYRKSKLLHFHLSVADWAKAIGTAAKVSPGVVAQNMAFGIGVHALGNLACKELEPGKNPLGLIHRRMLEELDVDELSLEEAQFLMRVAGEGARDVEPARQ